jgi:hypothetical protein
VISALALLLTMNFSHGQSNRIGFAAGADFAASSIEGDVSVTCSSFNNVGHAEYLCRNIVLEPAMYDYFVGPKEARAKRISLNVVHQDGSSREKTVEYDGQNGRSKEAFNLWVSTLFQRRMLEMGMNTVNYSLLDAKTNTEFSRGTVGVKVAAGAHRVCPAASYTSVDINDCNSQYSICQRYFEEFKNCK